MIRLIAMVFLFWLPTSWACEFKDVTFETSFEGARLNGCEQESGTHYNLLIAPENRPINNSPWYAFGIRSKKPKTLQISIQFDGNPPRYLPKLSSDRKTWKSIPFKMDSNALKFEVHTTSDTIFVAGQEMFVNKDYEDWYKKSEFINTRKVVLGTSTEKRPIHALYSTKPDNKEWLIILGRQHPPELTGVFAMLPFVETVLSDQKLAQEFRDRFNILVVPNLNPDGVFHGNWRHNINGKDLNRDWKRFEQVETRLVHDAIQSIIADGGKLVFALDFHSTQQDIFYTMSAESNLSPADLVDNWLKEIKSATVSSFKVRPKPGHNPDAGVFKQYIADTYGVQAVTFEIGDNTNRHMIKHVAEEAAETLMFILLKSAPELFFKVETRKQVSK